MAFGLRTKRARQARGMSQSELAEKVGISQNAISLLEKRDSNSSKAALEIAEALGVDLVWLKRGGETPEFIAKFERESKSERREIREEKMDYSLGVINRVKMEDFTAAGPARPRSAITAKRETINKTSIKAYRIPVFDLELIKGDDALLAEFKEFKSFPEYTIEKLKVDPKSLMACTAPDSSMSKSISKNDQLLINTRFKSIDDTGIYAILLGNKLRFRRLFARIDGGYLIKAENTHFPDEDIAPSEKEKLKVMGRVVWREGCLQ